MSALGSLVVKIALEHAEFTKGLDKSSQEALRFAKNTQDAMDKAERAALNVAKSVIGIGAAYISTSAAFNSFNRQVDALAQLDDAAQKTGSSIENLSRIQKLATVFGQDFANQIEPAITKLARGIAGLEDPSNKAYAALKTLGIETRDNAGNLRDTSQITIEVAKRLQDYQDGAGKAAIATDLFGKSGAELLPFLNDMAENIDNVKGATKASTEEAAKYQDNLGKLKLAGGEFWQSLVADALPSLTLMTQKMAEAAKQGNFLKVAWEGIYGAFDLARNGSRKTQLEFGVKGLGEELKTLEARKKAVKGGDSIIEALYGSEKEIDAEIKRITALQKRGIDTLNKLNGAPTKPKADEKPKPQLPAGETEAQKAAREKKEAAEKEAKQRAEAAGRRIASENQAAQKAYDDLVLSINEKTNAMKMELDINAPLSESSKALIKIDAERALGKSKLTQAQYENIKSALAEQAVVETEKAQLEARSIAQENYFRLIEDSASAQREVTKTLEEKAKASDLELAKLTMSKSELVELEKARYNEQIAVLESEKAFLATNPHRKEEVVLIEKQIEALGRLRDNVGKSDALQETQRAKDEFFNSMEAQAHRVWSIFANEGGQSFKAIGQSLKAYVLDMLYQLTLKKFFVNISASFGATSTGGSQVRALASNGSLVDGIVGAFSKTNLAITNTLDEAIQGLSGDLISNGFEKLGGILQNNSATIAKFAPYAGAALQLAQGNWAGAAGTALGTAIGGPIGGLLGSALGSFVGGMFGGRVSTKKYSAGATGSYSDGVFSGNGLTGLAGYGRNAGGQDALIGGLEAYSKAFGGLLKGFGLNDSITTSASVFQRSSKKTRGWGYFGAEFDGGSVGYSTGHVGSAANAVTAIIDWILTTGMVESIQKSKLPEGVRLLFDGLADRTQIGNMITATLSLADAQEALLNRYGLTADLAGKVSIASGLAADDLAKFVTALSGTAFSSQKASEQLIQQREKLNALIGDAGGDIGTNASLNAFDAYLKSIDKQTAEGQAKFADLFMLRDSVGTMQQAWDQLMGNVGVAVYELLPASEQLKKDQEALNNLFAKYGLQVPKTADELAKLGQSIQQNFNAADEASIDLAMAFPTLVQAFMAAKDKVVEGGREMSDFTNLADFRAYKGVLNNYGATIANDYARVNGLVGNNRAGATTFEGAQINMLEVLKEMRDLAKETKSASRETAATLDRMTRQGLKTV